MASFIGAFLLAYLLSASFTDTLQLPLSSVQKLVTYDYAGLNFNNMVPGVQYSGDIIAYWAVPDSALAGLDGKSVTVKVTATADSNSSVFFTSASGGQSKEAEVYLHCDVQNGTCANTSVLAAEIPLIASVQQGESAAPNITLKSEIVESAPANDGNLAQGASQAQQLIQSISGAISGNSTENQSNFSIPQISIPAIGANSSANVSFLDSLRPEGNPQDPVGFLKNNPLISLTALVIVIIITGAYLLKSKD